HIVVSGLVVLNADIREPSLGTVQILHRHVTLGTIALTVNHQMRFVLTHYAAPLISLINAIPSADIANSVTVLVSSRSYHVTISRRSICSGEIVSNLPTRHRYMIPWLIEVNSDACLIVFCSHNQLMRSKYGSTLTRSLWSDRSPGVRPRRYCS